MFACSECVGANQTGPTLMKLTTICDVSHVISYTRPSSPLFFFWGHREEGLGTRLPLHSKNEGMKHIPTKYDSHTFSFHTMGMKEAFIPL